MAHQKVAIVGHSLVWWYNKFVSEDGSLPANFGFVNTDVQCILSDVKRGLVIDDLPLIRDDLVQFAPDVIFLILGDNDLYRTDAEDVAQRLIIAGTMLRAWTGGAKLIHIDLFPRFWSVDYDYYFPSYNQDAMWVNEMVREGVSDQDRTFTWTCKGPSFNDPKASTYFSDDGVHLNATGQVKLYRSLQKALHVFRTF